MKEQAEPRSNWTESAALIEVIRTTHTEGKGTQENPNRVVTKYWSKDGKLLAIHDPEDADDKNSRAAGR